MYEIPISLDLVGTMGFVQNSNARLLQIDCRIDKAPFRHCNMLQPCKKGEEKKCTRHLCLQIVLYSRCWSICKKPWNHEVVGANKMRPEGSMTFF